MSKRAGQPRRIALFGHFDGTNLGNEATLQAALYHLRRIQPDAEVTCICTDPQTTAATYHIRAIPIARTYVKSWAPPWAAKLVSWRLDPVSRPERLRRLMAAIRRWPLPSSYSS